MRLKSSLRPAAATSQASSGRVSVPPPAHGPLPVSSRPVLYGRLPKGVGTPLLESLTGFLARLAAARCLSVTDVLDLLVRPLVPPGTLCPRSDLSWFLTQHIARFDGVAAPAMDFVRALECLTGRNGLVLHTFLPWRRLFSAHGPGVIRQGGKRWCCRCLDRMHADGVECWEPLLWQLAPAVRCPEHRIPLSERCPSCGRPLRVATQLVPLGYCERCGHLLHRDDPLLESGDFDPERDPDSQREWWVSVAFGQMLSAQSMALRHAGPEGFAALLREAVERPGASLESLVRDLGLHRSAVEPWLKGSRLPRLRPFLTACVRLGASPAEVGTGLSLAPRGAVGCPWRDAAPAAVFSRRRAAARWTRAVPVLDRMIAEGAHRSVEGVERELGLPRGEVQRRDPERYAVLRAHCAERRRGDRQALRERAGGVLARAIGGCEPRSAYAVARSVGVCSDTLEQWFPVEYRRLVALHAERRSQANRELLDRRCDAVRTAVFELVRLGTHPSFPAVLSHAGLPPTLCRVPAVRAACEAALTACGIDPLPQGSGSGSLGHSP